MNVDLCQDYIRYVYAYTVYNFRKENRERFTRFDKTVCVTGG